MNVTELHAAQILAIPPDSPHKLFTAENLKDEHRQLRGRWHPDKNSAPDASQVFDHIQRLHAKALEFVASSSWPGEAVLHWRGPDSNFSLKYLQSTPFELGQQYVATKHLAWKIDEAHMPLIDNAVNIVRSFRYRDSEMENQFAPLLPSDFPLWREDRVVMTSKAVDALPLRAVLNFLGGKMPPRHVAWIVSRLHNLAAYLRTVDISHQAICVDALFISPKKHSIFLLGGWWYASKLDSSVTHVPAALMSLYPRQLLTRKRAIVETDQALIKAVALELLGDPTRTGTPLLKRVGHDDLPEPMLRYLQAPPENNPFHAYKTWETVLDESFGKRKFVELNITENDVYSK